MLYSGANMQSYCLPEFTELILLKPVCVRGFPEPYSLPGHLPVHILIFTKTLFMKEKIT